MVTLRSEFRAEVQPQLNLTIVAVAAERFQAPSPKPCNQSPGHSTPNPQIRAGARLLPSPSKLRTKPDDEDLEGYADWLSAFRPGEVRGPHPPSASRLSLSIYLPLTHTQIHSLSLFLYIYIYIYIYIYMYIDMYFYIYIYIIIKNHTHTLSLSG